MGTDQSTVKAVVLKFSKPYVITLEVKQQHQCINIHMGQ